MCWVQMSMANYNILLQYVIMFIFDLNYHLQSWKSMKLRVQLMFLFIFFHFLSDFIYYFNFLFFFFRKNIFFILDSTCQIFSSFFWSPKWKWQKTKLYSSYFDNYLAGFITFLQVSSAYWKWPMFSSTVLKRKMQLEYSGCFWLRPEHSFLQIYKAF